MGVRVVYDVNQGVALLYCSTSLTAFGPVFMGAEALQDAWAFLDWVSGPGVDYADEQGIRHRDGDPRTFTPDGLARVYAQWRTEPLEVVVDGGDG